MQCSSLGERNATANVTKVSEKVLEGICTHVIHMHILKCVIYVCYLCTYYFYISSICI
jgi:hypothetical protein